MLVQHVEQNADVTVGCLEVAVSEASAFGVMHVDDNNYIRSFVEKPKDPPTMPGKPTMALASMGIYVFDTAFLFEQLRRDAADPHSSHDFGKDIIPYIVRNGSAVAHHFSRSCVRTSGQAAVLLARRRHARRLLGGQHGPHRHRAAARSLRPQLADLDLCRDLTAGQIRARPGRAPRPGGLVAGLRRLHHLGCHGAAVAAVHQRPPAVLLGGGERGRPAGGGGRTRGRASRTSSSIAACAFPPVWWSARTPRSTQARFRRTEGGICLITQAMIDKLGE